MAGDIGGVPVETAAGSVAAHDRARAGVCGGFQDVPERDPAPGAAVMDVCGRVCGPAGLVIPARRATRRSARAATAKI